MPYDNLSLASTGLQADFTPKLPRRLISWISRLTSPTRAMPPAETPPPAHVLLQQLLDRHPQARTVFAHLAAVEMCLQMEGVDVLEDLPWCVLEQAQAELLSISGGSDVQPLLELLFGPQPSTLAQPPAPSLQARADIPLASPKIENLEVDEVDEEAYLSALLEWEESAHMGCTTREAGYAN
jgi:hypothetical protein